MATSSCTKNSRMCCVCAFACMCVHACVCGGDKRLMVDLWQKKYARHHLSGPSNALSMEIMDKSI